MSALPTEVSQKANAAREQLAALHKIPGEPSQVGIEALKSVADTPGVETPVVTEISTAPIETPQPQPVVESKPQPVKEPTPSTEPTVEKKPKTDRTDWKHRFKMLQASREGTKADLDTALLKLDQANQRIAQLTEPQVQAKTKFELDEDARAALDESEAQVIDRLGQHVDDRFDKLEENQRQEQARLSDEFFEELTIVVPTWKALDTDVSFNTWLDTVDPAVGVLRRTALNRFVERRNVQAISGLINAFEKESVSGQPQTPVVDPISPEPNSQRSAPPTKVVDEEVEFISPNDVSEFYAEKNRLYRAGKLRGELLETVNAQEIVIRQAMRENRVR